MSLLIPTENDFEDAHANPQLEPEYQARLQELRNTNENEFKWDFEPVSGFFQQTDPSTDDLKFRYTECNLGRLKSWEQIQADLKELNKNAKSNECYKLIICARHGQGYHNQVVEKYGLDAWQAKWKTLGTDGTVNYAPDAMLTELGLSQAAENHLAWKTEIEEHGAPVPDEFYASPLQRSCWTCLKTWEGLRGDKTVEIKEILRETIGVNLCDKRSPKSVIEERFAQHGFVVEPGFSEEDELHGDVREPEVDQSVRINRFCQWLFEKEWKGTSVDKQRAQEKSIISTTTHAGTIRSFIVALNHRRFTISTGGMVPIVVKATRRE